jgi:hypothetical protein
VANLFDVVAIAADFGHGLTLTKDNIVGLGSKRLWAVG